MHTLLLISLILLGGCTQIQQQTADISGLWINQAAIDTAAQGRPLLKALDANGMNLEWNIDTRTGKAQLSTAFEVGEGQLLPKAPGIWSVDYNGHGSDELQLNGEQLIQKAKAHYPQQTFQRPVEAPSVGATRSTTFRKALNAAYLGGRWHIVEGLGAGGPVVFEADGEVSGLTDIVRYELCLDGDCSSQGAGHDTIYLGAAGHGQSWIFVRKGKQLEIFQAINTAQMDEIPQFTPGPRRWLLEKQ